MRKEYDFTAARKNPYAAQLKKPVTIRLDFAHKRVSERQGGAVLSHNQWVSPSGEIGRHIGLKIRRFVNNGRTGSIPVSGTKQLGIYDTLPASCA
jgi:hypothetical protein